MCMGVYVFVREKREKMRRKIYKTVMNFKTVKVTEDIIT